MAVLNSQLRLTLLDQVSGKLRGISGALNAFQGRTRSMMSPLTGTVGRLAAFGTGYLGVTQGIQTTVGAALEFESAFADVRKVLNGSDEQLANVRNQILGMSKELPIAASGIAAIYASAAQADVPMNELGKFTEMVAKVSTAWDVPVEETGQALAEIKTQLHMNVGEIGLYADAINHLGNNSAARSPDLIDFSKRVASTGEMYGYTATQSLAFGGAMISSGAQSEVAATSFRNMGRALTIGTRATKMQRGAMGRLGIDSVKTAKSMQKNALKTTLDVIEKIQALPEWERISVAGALFGDEARSLMPVINNSTELRKQLALVGDTANYSGSAFKEYVLRASTVGNVLAIMRNKLADVFRGIGDDMLPSLREAALGVGDIIDSLGERATIFDRMGAAIRGLMAGFGVDGGIRQTINDLGDLLFGAADGSASADALGRLFEKFRGWGASLREFTSAVAANPIAQFIGSMSGYGFDLMVATAGITLLAGAVMSLGRAMMFLSGASAAISILKALAGVGGAIFGAAGAGGGKPKVESPKATSGLLPMLAALGKALPWVAALMTPGDTADNSYSGASAEERQRMRDETRKRYDEANPAPPAPTGPRPLPRLGIARTDLPAGLPATTPLPLSKGDLSSVTISTKPTGIQQVQMTNPPPRPNVSITQNITINEAAAPAAAASAIGAAVKNELDSSFGGAM